MSEEDVIVASTVVLPEPADEEESSPTRTNKRRASSTSSSTSKRQRLDSNDRVPAETRPGSSRRAAADIDERKRGKRLFGGLLGTLSQDSSSTSQRRRVDIERKQREKLRAQKEEDEEAKRYRQGEADIARRAKEKIWDAESRHTRHENERALARFLRTRTQPVLYYKPWELRSEETNLIKQQIEEVGRKLELEEREIQHPLQDAEDNQPQQDRQPSEDIKMGEKDSEPLDDRPVKADGSQSPHLGNGHLLDAEDTQINDKGEDSTNHGQSPKHGDLIANESHASPDAMKDGMEEVVQGDEDAVLY